MDRDRLAELVRDPYLTVEDKLAAARREGFDPTVRDLGIQVMTDRDTGETWEVGAILAEIRLGDMIHSKMISYTPELDDRHYPEIKPNHGRVGAFALLYAYVYGELR